jgi:hypothetical protein
LRVKPGVTVAADIESERETAYLISDGMRRRLTEAREREGGISIEDVVEKVRI